ncbi:hypothetical protein diail_6238 [Diaporthe ilicicola]|nr:hypothetical protein diail_6238 [Diaporthe ilicicola]
MTTTTSDSDIVSGYHGAGPLTTVFTTPDFCASLYWTDTLTPPLSSVVCMPPKFHSLYDYSFGFYSPGICPTGYSKGCDFPVDRARVEDDGGAIYFGGPVLEGETVRVCCPNGYTCLENTVSSYSKCVHTTDNSQLAFALQVRWQESDLSILATDPTVAGKTYSAPSTATATPATIKSTSGSHTDANLTPTPSSSSSTTVAQNNNTGSTTKSGLSTGTIAGIAIGVGGMVFAFAVCALIFFVCRQRKKKREKDGTSTGSTISGAGGDSKPAPGGFATDQKAELDSRAMASSTVLSEAQADRDAAEMPPLHIAATEMEVPHFVAELPGSMPPVQYSAKQGGLKAPRSPLPTAETSQRESGALGNQGLWKKRSVARTVPEVSPISRPSTSASTASLPSTSSSTEERRQTST